MEHFVAIPGMTLDACKSEMQKKVEALLKPAVAHLPPELQVTSFQQASQVIRNKTAEVSSLKGKVSLILGLCFSSYTEVSIIFSDLEYVLAFFVKLTGFFSLCLFLGILVKRSAFAIGFLLVLSIAEGIAKGVLTFKIFPDSPIAGYITQFFPLEAMSNLIVEPFSRLSLVKTIGSQIGVENTKDYGVAFTTILIVLGWIVVLNLLSYKILKKRDL